MHTEQVTPRSRGLDLWPPLETLQAFYEGQLAAVAAIGPALGSLAGAVEAAAVRLAGDTGRLIYVGAGTSGRLAIQDAVELTPTFRWPEHRRALVLAGGAPALTGAVEGAEDDGADGASRITALAPGPADVAVGVAASGQTAFTRQALQAARSAGALTIGIANVADTPILAEVDRPILLQTGAEAIAGSTRMKAGTAQRAALTLFSSALMVHLGRVHDGRMVDVLATNAKLERRALAMVRDLTGADTARAEAALAEAGGHAKTAVVMLAKGIDAAGAARILDAAGGRLRHALAADP